MASRPAAALVCRRDLRNNTRQYVPIQDHCGPPIGVEEVLLSDRLQKLVAAQNGEASEPTLLPSGRGANAITSRLRHAIETGVFVVGDKLPPERNLATAFSSARSTVRKALERLELEGLVARRVGSGTFVAYDGPLHGHTGEISDLISPLQLIEARIAIEPYIARLAAIHATQRDLEAMETVLLQLEACGGDKDQFTQLDGEFHLSIARCARNPLLLQVYEQINDIRAHALWTAMKEKILTPSQIDIYNAQHRGIFEVVRARDAQGVSDRIKEHLDKARRDLVGAESG